MLQRLLALTCVFLVTLCATSIMAQENQRQPIDVPIAPQTSDDAITELVTAPTDVVRVIIEAVPESELASYDSVEKLPELAQQVATTLPGVMPAFKFMGYSAEETDDGTIVRGAVLAGNEEVTTLLDFKHTSNCAYLNSQGNPVTLTLASLVNHDGMRGMVLALAGTQVQHRRQLKANQQFADAEPNEKTKIAARTNWEVKLKIVKQIAVSLR